MKMATINVKLNHSDRGERDAVSEVITMFRDEEGLPHDAFPGSSLLVRGDRFATPLAEVTIEEGADLTVVVHLIRHILDVADVQVDDPRLVNGSSDGEPNLVTRDAHRSNDDRFVIAA